MAHNLWASHSNYAENNINISLVAVRFYFRYIFITIMASFQSFQGLNRRITLLIYRGINNIDSRDVRWIGNRKLPKSGEEYLE